MVRQLGLWVDRWGPRLGRVLGGMAFLLIGIAVGLAVARYGLVVPLATLAGLATALVSFFYPWAGLLLATLIAILLPFAALPVRLGLTPTFLEVALLGFLAGWALPPLLRRERHWRFSALDALAWAFVAVTVFALLLGLGRGVDATTLHNYGKTLLGVLVFFGVRQVVTKEKQVRWFLALLLLAAGLAALVGLVLHALPDRTALNLLVRLDVLGYPSTGRVLRYVEDDPSGLERAISTSVDPNSFGGMLAVVATVALGQLLMGFPTLRKNPQSGPGKGAGVDPPPRGVPALPYPILIAVLALLLAAIYLTYSRAALGGFIVGVLFLAVVRYRHLWWAVLVGAVLLGALIAGLGLGGPVVERFRQGIRFQDQANQMRLAEYANAAAIIRRYPLFGVGFGQAPDVDLSTGVSSLYLTIAEHMGLMGLAAFLVCVGVAFVQVLRRCWHVNEGTGHLAGSAAGHRLALLAGMVTALAIGLLDHYFFNLEFPHMVTLFWAILGMATVL